MARGVNVPSGASAVHYHTYEGEDQHEYEEHLQEIASVVQRRLRSMKTKNLSREWLDREARVVAENDYAYVAVSGYMNMVSVALVPKLDEYDDDVEANHQWCRDRYYSFVKCLDRAFDGLRKLGTASNGESFFTQA